MFAPMPQGTSTAGKLTVVLATLGLQVGREAISLQVLRDGNAAVDDAGRGVAAIYCYALRQTVEARQLGFRPSRASGRLAGTVWSTRPSGVGYDPGRLPRGDA
jgi:hypothetical protein